MTTFLPNLRDVGGLPVPGGGRVRAGRVLRSAAPMAGDAVPEGLVWPPAVVLDLRSAGELASVHPLAGPSTRVVNVPLLEALRPDAHPVRDLTDLYRVMLDHSSARFVEVLREVADTDGPALLHCAAGKDRTGVSVALVLRLLGVEHEHVVADYLATEKEYDAIDARLSQGPGAANRAHLPASFFTTPVEAIESVLDRWDAADGGVEGWATRAGADEKLLDRLRTSLVD
ncbi:tyrosine-protein phosphatase [Aeromicrobium sp. IC_218]|uniref:tyrosine-protein phosphatase n=1 Tax=Aeromicrobium sp. IC_218 TaxID=2545468 RepID=UPI0010386747|nr:tyrosine-protein phosphatase [Aeromicrobium sp. IC_218]TCI98652.1 tyrosine-protein phosphatase [Aeromicrobium sp. IC_218]